MVQGVQATNSHQSLVREFMIKVKELELPIQPTIPADDVKALCVALIREELAELKTALIAGDLVEVADAIGDLEYVIHYTANACGIWSTPIFEEIHRSNMTKLGGPKAKNGKQLKPPWYEPPNLEPILEAQSYEIVSYIDDEPQAYMSKKGKILQDG